MNGLDSEMQPLAAGEEIALNPYAFQPGIGSRIPGLATGQTGPDLNYVFHTDYISVGRGYAEVRVRFAGLEAREGTLMLRVHLVREESDGRLRVVLVTSERIAFNRLIQNGGETTLRFEVFNNCRYAIYGSVLGETDARADGLEVLLRKPQEVEEPGFHTEARNSDQGRASARPHSMLVSTAVPVLSAPVSQVATAAQLRSREGKAALDATRLPADAGPVEQWTTAYIVRALEAYGVVGQDSRGLGFVRSGDPVARLLESRSAAVDCLYDRDGQALISARDRVNYDFLWRQDRINASLSGVLWMEEMEETLKALLPGGLAVLTFPYDPTPPIALPTRGWGQVAVNRRDLERLALVLISRGHEVAQLRVVGDYEPLLDDGGVRNSAAGLIVRRARIPD